MTDEAPKNLGDKLEAEFDAWFKELQKLSPEPLDPEDWPERWFDGYTPAEALEDGPEEP